MDGQELLRARIRTASRKSRSNSFRPQEPNPARETKKKTRTPTLEPQIPPKNEQQTMPRPKRPHHAGLKTGHTKQREHELRANKFLRHCNPRVGPRPTERSKENEQHTGCKKRFFHLKSNKIRTITEVVTLPPSFLIGIEI
jgi:hypothetical protein